MAPEVRREAEEVGATEAAVSVQTDGEDPHRTNGRTTITDGTITAKAAAVAAADGNQVGPTVIPTATTIGAAVVDPMDTIQLETVIPMAAGDTAAAGPCDRPGVDTGLVLTVLPTKGLVSVVAVEVTAVLEKKKRVVL